MGLAGPVDLKACLAKRREKIGAVFDLALFDLHEQVGVNGVLGFGAFILPGRLSPADQPGLVQVRVFGRAQARPGGIVRPGPAFPVVVQVAEHVEVLLPAGRAGVEGLAA